jgi:hypothetical protein
MSQAGTIGAAGGGGEGNEITLTANTGSATSVSHILNVLGVGGISTNASGNTLNIVSTESFTPNSQLQEFDDFLRSENKLDWVEAGVFSEIDGLLGHPGLLGFQTGAGSQSLTLGDNATGNPIALGGGQLSINFVIDLDALSNVTDSYTFYVGLSDWTSTQNTVPPINGVFISYTNSVNAGSYVLNSTNSSTTTSVNSSVIATTGFVNYGIVVNASGTSISYFINGTLVAGGPITTNIPTAAISPFFMIISNTGNTPSGSIDLFYINLNLTTPR